MANNFQQRLAEAIEKKNSRVCVGLDPRYEQLPADLREKVEAAAGGRNALAVAESYRLFCRGVIEAVTPYAVAVKPQFAFFEAAGPTALAALTDIITFARSKGLLVIADAKRGDIGSTAEAYASAYLAEDSPWRCDALTANPYLGGDSVRPLLKTAADNGNGVYLLVRTSNPGAVDLQDVKLSDDTLLWQKTAKLVSDWSAEFPGAVGAVLGATYPAELLEGQAVMGDLPLLIPGYGAQGATAADIAPALTRATVVNSSRGIIFARPEGEESWIDAIARAAQLMRDDLNSAVKGEVL